MSDTTNGASGPSHDGTKETDAKTESNEEQVVLEPEVEISGSAATLKLDPTAEWKSRVAYLSAEIENMRKRFARERIELMRNANEALLRALLPAFDNLEMALKAAHEGEMKLDGAMKENPVFTGLLKGVEMTFRHFEQTLNQAGVGPISSVGVVFDPVHHEAMGQICEAEKADGVVLSEMQRGFVYGGRVLRPAKVLINKIQN